MREMSDIKVDKAGEFVGAVAQFADQVFARCDDRYGMKQTLLLVDGINLETGEPARWEGHVLSNPACQQNFLRALVGLGALTGDGAYRQKAEGWIGCALERIADPASDLLYWGGHSSYDLEKDAPVVGNHEMKCVYPFYEFFYEVDPERTRRFVEGMWHKHVADWSTLLFNRHGEYEAWDRSRCWKPGRYEGGELPIVENTLLSFVNTGSDLICAGTLLHCLDGEEEPVLWARRLLHRYEEVRNRETGLAGYQFNHREPCRVRMSFKPPLSEREDVNETTVITNNVIRTRYGRAAVAFMNLCERLGVEEGRPFFDLVTWDLRALAEHAYDEGDHSFCSVLHDGTRVFPEDAVEGVGYCPPDKLERVAACGLMFLAYSRAYRLSGEPRFLQVAQGMAEGMGGGDLESAFAEESEVSPSALEGWSNPNQDDVCALFGLLDLYRSTEREEYLATAARRGERLMWGSLVDGFFTTGAEGRDGYSRIDSALPLGLLHLAAAIEGREVELPAFYPNLSYFDPKVVVARRKRG